jgi:hypothetical protein
MLRQAYKANPDSWTLFPLCWELALSDPIGAAKLATGWLKSAERRDGKDGQRRMQFQDEASPRTAFFVALASCDRLLKRGKAKAAVALVEQTAAPQIPHLGVDAHDSELLALMRAKVLSAAGEHQRAYNELIVHDQLLMSDAMLAVEIKLGAKLGKSRRQVAAEAWQHRLSAEHAVAEFEVPGPRGRTIKASDYRGRPLLVNAWNPG